MFEKIKNYLIGAYFKTISTIAFYPTIISLLFLSLSFLCLTYLDDSVTEYLEENYPMLVINNPDTARSILSTLIGGIISLTVFSFSMVMVLLSQASSNFSPRLLPGLISDTRNQVTLGIFLGTIIFNMIVLITILPGDSSFTNSGFSVLIGIVFGILCLGMFVYFIHHMSSEIQIGNILDRIFKESKDRLEDQIALEKDIASIDPKEITNWHVFKCEKAVYYQGINKTGLLKKMQSEKINIKVLPHKGMYTLPNTDLLLIDKKLDEEVRSEILSYLIFENNHEATDNYVVGMRQICEVGIKAMSPGINDPGTAIIGIDYLTELLALRMQLSDIEEYETADGKYSIQLKTINFDALLYELLASYRLYSKHDAMVMEKLINMLLYLRDQRKKSDQYAEVLKTGIKLLKVDIKENIKNEFDRKRLLKMID
jgi:uncharacterized membrane protein